MELHKSLLSETGKTFTDLENETARFDSALLNTVPRSGGWTAGQVIEHVIKSTGGIPDNVTEPADRPFDEKVEAIKNMFLDMNLKFETDPSIAPAAPPHDKDDLIGTIQNRHDLHLNLAKQDDLEALCLDMELPTFGLLTRYEWLKFMLFHTQRHTVQLANIYCKLKPKSN